MLRQITNVRIFLLFGVAWTFDTGPLSTGASPDFVSLPASMAVSVTNPPLPLAAGSYSTLHVFGDKSGKTTAVVSKGNLAAQLDPPLTTMISLSFNGTPGFPVQTVNGAETVHVQMTDANGAGVFCLDMTVPLKSLPFGGASTRPGIPLLTPIGLAILALLVGGCGIIAARRRRLPIQRRATPVS